MNSILGSDFNTYENCQNTKYPQDMGGGMKTVNTRDLNKKLSSEFLESYWVQQKHLKKAEEYSDRNVVTLATKMSITVCTV